MQAWVAWVASIDWTQTLAVLQTVAGFGSIFAAIWLSVSEFRRGKAERLRTEGEFIQASIALIKALNEHTTKAVHALEAAPGTTQAVEAKAAWMQEWGPVNDAILSLRERAPADARIILSLTRCVRALRRGGGVHLYPADLGLAAELRAILDALEAELRILRSKAREYMPGVWRDPDKEPG